METKKCSDCIHADLCEINEYLPEFSRENNAVGCLAFTDNRNFVEVVRCMDCKFYNSISGLCGVDRKLGQTLPAIRVKHSDFCSYGESKGE